MDNLNPIYEWLIKLPFYYWIIAICFLSLMDSIISPIPPDPLIILSITYFPEYIIFTIILGMMSLKIFFEAIALIPIYLLFSLIGDFLYKYSNDNLYKKIALVVFLFFGLIILFK